MVTTRRRITTEQDRFGGYGIQATSRIATEDPLTDSVTHERDDSYSFAVTDEPTSSRMAYTESRNAYTVIEEEPPQQQSVIEYSSWPQYTYQPAVAPARAKKARKRENEDVMPSIRTRAYARQEAAVEQEIKPASRVKLTGKTKVALAVYLVCVVVLAALVIATGLAVSNINARASVLENEIAVKNAQVLEQNAQIRHLTDLDYVKGVATGKDMAVAQPATEVELVPTSDPMHYQGRTNWFDKFCDFLSNIIGG